MTQKKKGRGAVGGIEEVAKMLQHLDEPDRSRILVELARKDPRIAAQVQSKMFTIEDLVQLEPKRVQSVLRTIPQGRLALSLRGTSEKLRGFVYANLPSKVAQMVREELETTPPQKKSDVAAAQAEVLAKFR